MRKNIEYIHEIGELVIKIRTFYVIEKFEILDYGIKCVVFLADDSHVMKLTKFHLCSTDNYVNKSLLYSSNKFHDIILFSFRFNTYDYVYNYKYNERILKL